jgi:hypothetical protein
MAKIDQIDDDVFFSLKFKISLKKHWKWLQLFKNNKLKNIKKWMNSLPDIKIKQDLEGNLWVI